MDTLKTLQDQLNYQFKNGALLVQALSHRSVNRLHNERLEFLGDAILDFIIADELYRHFPSYDEGQLSCSRSALVNGVYLAECARYLTLNHYLILGVGEEKSGGRERQSLLANAFEAVVGAIYLDSDITICRKVVLEWYQRFDPDWINRTPVKDAKSELQEWCQSKGMALPHYQCDVKGPAHEQIFMVVCRITDLDYEATATSTTRRKAEQLAAQQYMELIHAG